MSAPGSAGRRARAAAQADHDGGGGSDGGDPKTRTGSFLPSLLEPRRRMVRALHAVIREAYVHGVSTRKVDDLVVAMGDCRGSRRVR
jgi:transposase-like protein